MGLSLVAPEADVKRQYRKLAAQVHPDKCKLEGAEEAFKLLGRAVAHALSNADKNRYTMVHICTCAAVLLVQAQVCSAQSGWELFQQDLYRAQHAIAQATLKVQIAALHWQLAASHRQTTRKEVPQLKRRISVLSSHQ